MHKAPKEVHPGHREAVSEANEADMLAGSGGTVRQHHATLRSGPLDDGVGAEPVRELLDPGHAMLAALFDNVGRAVLAREPLPGLVAAHRDDRSAPSCLAASTASSPTAPSPTTATVLPGPA